MRILNAETGLFYIPYQDKKGKLKLQEVSPDENPKANGDTIIWRKEQ